MDLFKTLSLILVAAAALSACGGKESESKKETSFKDSISVFKVKVDTVKMREIDQTVDFTATVEPEIKNNIASTTPGRIMAILTEVGKTVAKGQVLVKMDPMSLLNAKTQLINLENDYNRTLELMKAGGASQQAVDQLKVQLDVAKETYRNLQENIELRSPISGIVTARNFDNGDLYQGTTPILTVMKIKPVKIKIAVSETYFKNIKLGMPVTVTTDAYDNTKYNGKVSLIYPTIDQSTRTFSIEIIVDNNNGAIRPGMFARVTMNLGKQKHVVVPDNSIVKRQGSGDRYVYVYHDNGTVSFNKVELGKRLDAEYELLSGVEDNSVVVVSGQNKLNDGASVEIIE